MEVSGRADTHLCDCCEDTFESILRPTAKYQPEDGSDAGVENINVGWLDSIVANSQCSLCRLITRAWEIVAAKDIDRTRRVYVMIGNFHAAPLTATGQRRGWTMVLEFFYPGANGQYATPVPIIYEPRFAVAAESHQLAPDGIFATDAVLFGRIRRREKPYDRFFLRDCVRSCLLEHGDACRQPVRHSTRTKFPLKPSRALPEDLHVVDVLEHQVTTLPPEKDYTILSYVWGQSHFLTLTKANFDQLTATGGLRSVMKPRTIADAMEVTAAVGMRYIWIDSLCIVQDSDEQKIRFLSRMDDIYTSAALTIVAAGGAEANAGLWPRDNTAQSKQIVEAIGGLSFVLLEPPLAHVLEHSVYSSRAWTWQEYALSKRLLVFSMSQAYFSCEQSAYAEDYVHMIRSDGQLQVPRIPQDTELEILADQVSNFPVYWRTLILEYTKRAMTFEGDGLNALKGVLASYCRGTGETPICGLPVTTLFEYGLMWFPIEPLRRRASTATEMFPSWSWLGWVGAVHYEDIDDDKHIEEERIVHRWSLQSSLNDGQHKKPFPVHVCCDYGEVTFETEPGQPADMCDLSALEAGILRFSTLSLHCQVTRPIQAQFVFSDDHHCRHTGLYAIMLKDKHIGGVHLEHKVAEALLRDTCERHEFIVLSAPLEPWYLPARVSQTEYDEDGDLIPLFDSRLLDGENSSDTVYNVMLITREGDLASRVGIGQIHKESFHAAGPLMKGIRLG